MIRLCGSAGECLRECVADYGNVLHARFEQIVTLELLSRFREELFLPGLTALAGGGLVPAAGIFFFGAAGRGGAGREAAAGDGFSSVTGEMDVKDIRYRC